MDKRYIDYDEFSEMILNLCKQIEQSDFNPDIIVPILRGGAVAGITLSHYFDVPMVGLTWSTRDCYLQDIGKETNCWLPEMAVEGTKILLVDDILDSGRTILEIQEDWNKSVYAEIPWGNGVKVAALQERYTSKVKADFCIENIADDDWVVYPWEIESDNIS